MPESARQKNYAAHGGRAKGPYEEGTLGNTLLEKGHNQTGNLHHGHFGDRHSEQLEHPQPPCSVVGAFFRV